MNSPPPLPSGWKKAKRGDREATRSMNLRHWYATAGLSWSLLLGPMVALGIFAACAGFAWIFLFGDDPWPPASEWMLPLPGLLGGLVTAIVLVRKGLGYGKARESVPGVALAAERRRAIILASVPLLLLLAIGSGAWIQARSYAEAMSAATAREAAYIDWAAKVHRISDVAVQPRADEIFRAMIKFSGERDGAYHLSWRVVAASSPAVLLTGDSELQLHRGSDDLVVRFPLYALQQRYQAAVLDGRGGVLVDQAFRLEVLLDPVLTERENADLPPGERRRLELDESPVRSSKTALFPVRFTIPG
jgi:hypothetical protein